MGQQSKVDIEMGWDDPVEADSGGGFTVIPKGRYRFIVEEFKRGRHQPGPNGKIPPCAKAMLTLGIYDDNGERLGKVDKDLFLVKSLEWMLAAFFRAIGQKKHGERIKPDWSKVQDSAGWCDVDVRRWAKRDEKGKPESEWTGESNELEAFVDPDKAEPPETAAEPGLGF